MHQWFLSVAWERPSDYWNLACFSPFHLASRSSWASWCSVLLRFCRFSSQSFPNSPEFWSQHWCDLFLQWEPVNISFEWKSLLWGKGTWASSAGGRVSSGEAVPTGSTVSGAIRSPSSKYLFSLYCMRGLLPGTGWWRSKQSPCPCLGKISKQ